MKTTINLSVVLIIGLLFFSCKSTPENLFDKEAEQKKLFELFDLNKQLLLTEDLSFYRKAEPCTDSSIVIGRGNIFTFPTKQTDEQLIDGYGFKRVNYTNIDELMKPVIRFSPDGKMAFVTGRYKAQYEKTDSLGNITGASEFISATLTVYEKHGDCWSEAVIAQTFERE